MAASNDFGNDLALLLFNNTTLANIGDGTGIIKSTADGDFYIALHTADPGVGGKQNVSEADYGGYARVAVARTTGGFTVAGKAISNAAEVAFVESTSGTNTLTYFSVGYEISGATYIVSSNVLDTSRTVDAAGIILRFAIGELDVTIT
jgi:hypothetical protein